jgi:hypothetical protein
VQNESRRYHRATNVRAGLYPHAAARAEPTAYRRLADLYICRFHASFRTHNEHALRLDARAAQHAVHAQIALGLQGAFKERARTNERTGRIGRILVASYSHSR